MTGVVWFQATFNEISPDSYIVPGNFFALLFSILSLYQLITCSFSEF
ncbi:hypothetical protein ABIB62_004474 [Mucilaginibacter sp. UYP25]